VATAFYLPTSDADTFLATEDTGGPWDAALQHGGPPAALLARAAERETASWPFTVVRMAVEILGPVPVGEVSIASHVARSGRSVELIEAELSAGGRVAARARAWRVRLADLELPPAIEPPTDVPPMPTQDTSGPPGWPGGFIAAMQLRFAAGSWVEPGPATVWARQRVPLIDGEEPSGLQRLMVLADCGNGVSNALPIGEWMFINPDLTVHLSRYPTGHWICIEAETTADRRGFGVATSTLYDADGRVGHGAQSLFIGRR
jgi:Thioesterase-like superfamily